MRNLTPEDCLEIRGGSFFSQLNNAITQARSTVERMGPIVNALPESVLDSIRSMFRSTIVANKSTRS